MEKHKDTIIMAAAVTAAALVVGALMTKKGEEEPAEDFYKVKDRTEPTERYHLGIETGGTTCKIGVMKDVNSLVIEKSVVIKTSDPSRTVYKICKWINEQPEQFSSMGVAAFGPLCLDKSSTAYGSVTTTPKVAWQKFPLLKTLLAGIKEEKMTQDFRVVFDTDCNILAAFELENGGHQVKDNIAYITVGTGVGVGFVINGQSIHGLIHPEGGHVAVPLLP